MKFSFNIILYPFQPQNIKATVMIPGGLICLFVILQVLCGIIAGVFIWETGTLPIQGILGTLLLVVLIPFSLILMLFLAIIFMGYQWRLTGIAQQSNFQEGAPLWTQGEWEDNFRAGLHCVGYLCILLIFSLLLQSFWGMVTGYQHLSTLLNQPVLGDFMSISYRDPTTISTALNQPFWEMLLLTALSLIPLFPFLLGPLFYNAQDPDLLNLLTHLPDAWRWTCSRYWQVLSVSTVGQFCFVILLGILSLIASLTVIGVIFIPFILLSGFVLSNCLYVYAFSTPPSLQNQLQPCHIYVESDPSLDT